jgi:hypothetical protein
MIPTNLSSRRATAVAAIALATGALIPPATLGHGPTPVLSATLWGQSQAVEYRFRSGNVPPQRIQPAIHAAAADSNESRNAKAAVFRYDAGGTSLIGYGVNATCGVNGIACFTRSAPTSFTMWFREHGHVFDWGTLRWCQMYDSPPNGCFDVENIALDEFGHVQVLAHHINYTDNSDYLDSVVQTTSRTKPNSGWNVHAYGRCDVATLQREYDPPSWTAKYSTCLDIQTELTLGASATSVAYLGSATFTARLKASDLDSYKRIGGNPISGRAVVLQWRSPSGTTWNTLATMAAGSESGTYTYSASSLTGTRDWRAVFTKPKDEGLRGDTSPTLRVNVSPRCGALEGEPGTDEPATEETCE